MISEGIKKGNVLSKKPLPFTFLAISPFFHKIKQMMSTRIEQFEDLRVWQNGIELVKQIYFLTKEGELSRDYGLRDQLRRASTSIPTNIAEGFERRSRKEYLYFLNIAKGSAGEVRSLLRVALEVGYLNQTNYAKLYNQVKQLSSMLSNQIQSISKLPLK